jgi:hypothetical protein
VLALGPDGSHLGAPLGVCQLPMDFGGELLAMPAESPGDHAPGIWEDSSTGKELQHSRW